MRRFYLKQLLQVGESIHLPEEESKHISKVLRMNHGDELALVNGKGDCYTAVIAHPHPKACQVTIVDQEKVSPDAFHIHIAIAPTKNIDRFEYFLEKSTELGIHEITPILTTNSERKTIKTERLEKVIIAAMKQSKRLFLPQLNELTTLKAFLEKHPKGMVAHCYDEKDKNKFTSTLAQQNIPMLIGPEGDFSSEEITLLKNNGYIPVTLGNTRLRTETAGIYACALFKSFLE